MNPGRPPFATPRVVLMVLASGAAALTFETLWFRLAALMLGSSVWASSLVLAAFMAGLAIGNAFAARAAAGWRRPLRAYAALEIAVALLATAVVWTIPSLTAALAPLLGARIETPLALNALRLVVAFGLLVVPAAAMGATLPALVQALGRRAESFGTLLGRLYGWNTAGALCGALLGELVLIERFGLRGTALAAAALDLLAAALALRLDGRLGPLAAEPAPAATPVATARGRRFLAAAALAGALLLALEVVWFRCLSLRVLGTARSFAAMLAVVLAGIALGGLVAGRWCARRADAPEHASALACLAGGFVVASYAMLGIPTGHYLSRLPEIVASASLLMLPTCVISGMLFVFVAGRLEVDVPDRPRAAGLLTLANTLGSATGALLAGFVLLPRLGVEGALLVLAVAYAGVAALLLSKGRAAKRLAALAALALAVTLAVFPRGLGLRSMQAVALRFAGDGSTVLAAREGRLETLVYLRREAWGAPYYDWLLTNGFSMAGTNPGSQRYMKLFVYWPLALRPEAKSALLVCFGVGNSASALVHAPELESIDVVDISPDVIEMSGLLYPPAEHPLRDPRVRVHVEDGRFFLQTTTRRFDLITAEPPPPKNAGVVNLYSREYFALVRRHLNPGGIATHWLPVYQLSAADGRAVVAAFCSVFEDCSLWSGRGLEFMLAGTNGLERAPSEAGFTRAWSRPANRSELADIGFETPELLSATFLADAEGLRAFAAGQPPVDDDHPLRLSSRPEYGIAPAFTDLLEAGPARERFARSAWIERLWPAGVRSRTLDAFWVEDIANRLFGGTLQDRIGSVRRLLRETDLQALPLLLLDSTPRELRLAEAAATRGEQDPIVPYVRGLGALTRRDYAAAEALFAEAEAKRAPVSDLPAARAFASEMRAAALPR
jgi:predicted membrane-bound spermidine synthase